LPQGVVPEPTSQVAQTGEDGSKTSTDSTQQCPISSRACFNTRQVCNRKQLLKSKMPERFNYEIQILITYEFVLLVLWNT
jgi:hypothetical protein